ncbi:hypothetical protein ACFO1B_13565 [Dactylosporangium siamense]|uniref:Uncharacterized protein n=1 Tax=Dactylosporangium siamense TaxID=685454 RepID=A0A919UFL5_9ACTN|nr:hypothetical protein [Dactylosporangium siamense]GIG49750.1 hypothetical protein Dsi01nite_077910 [Dactylosporangium siamense]
MVVIDAYDVAGTVEATGQPVVAFTSHKSTQRGGYAQFVTLPADLVVPLPDGVAAVDAVPLPLAGMTASQALDARSCSCPDPLPPVVHRGCRPGTPRQ